MRIGSTHPAFVGAIAAAILLLGSPPTHAQIELDPYALSLRECEPECRKTRGGIGFPCYSWCAWMACVQEQSKEESPRSSGPGAAQIGVKFESHNRKYMARMSTLNPCHNTPPKCISLCDIARREIIQLGESSAERIKVNPIGRCEFERPITAYETIMMTCGIVNSLCKGVDLESLNENRKRALKEGPIFRRAVERLYAEIPTGEAAFAACRQYEITYTLDEDRVLTACDPVLLEKVVMLNQQVEDRFQEFTRAKATMESRIAAARGDLDLCRPYELITIDDVRSILNTCGSGLVADAEAVNGQIAALSTSLTMAQDAIDAGNRALENCSGFAAARPKLQAVPHEAPLVEYRCPEVGTANALDSRIGNFLISVEERKRRIERVLPTAEDRLRYCEWGELNRTIEQGRSWMISPVCLPEFPEFSRLAGRLDDLESRGATRADELRWRSAKIELHLAQVRRANEAGEGAGRCGDGFVRVIEENHAPLSEVVRDSRDMDLDACMLELVAQAENVLDQAESLRTDGRVIVPQIVGLDRGQATRLLADVCLSGSTDALTGPTTGTKVIGADPPPGARVAKDSVIHMRLGEGEPEERVAELDDPGFRELGQDEGDVKDEDEMWVRIGSSEAMALLNDAERAYFEARVRGRGFSHETLNRMFKEMSTQHAPGTGDLVSQAFQDMVDQLVVAAATLMPRKDTQPAPVPAPQPIRFGQAGWGSQPSGTGGTTGTTGTTGSSGTGQTGFVSPDPQGQTYVSPNTHNLYECTRSSGSGKTVNFTCAAKESGAPSGAGRCVYVCGPFPPAECERQRASYQKTAGYLGG